MPLATTKSHVCRFLISMHSCVLACVCSVHADCSPFMDEENPGPCVPVGDPSLALSPRAGRAVVFGSGRENPHRVTRVTEGTRYVLR